MVGRPTGKHGDGRARLLAAATRLFAEQGVTGTSLQMIADDLGVSKAAVYHQFPSKDAIVVAVFAPVFEELARITDEAEGASTPSRRFTIALEGLVDMALTHRELSSALQRDPTVARLVRTSETFRTLMGRVDRLLIGEEPTPQARVALATAGGGLMIAAADPSLTDLDEATVRAALLDTTRRALPLPFGRLEGTR